MTTRLILLLLFVGAAAWHNKEIERTKNAQKAHHVKIQTVDEINLKAKLLMTNFDRALATKDPEFIGAFFTEDCLVKFCSGQIAKNFCSTKMIKLAAYTYHRFEVEVAMETENTISIRVTISPENEKEHVESYLMDFTWEKRSEKFSYLRYFSCYHW